ncbi:MAG TPA: transcription repressor NadR [Thermotogaceae bacterium]|nr:transcription repressor NadR [Thermotogota bacterium]HEW92435.1 transcription repressor NadR [Thermotogaceae bacterium]
MKRRMQKILEILKKSEKPIKGRELARKLGVSRQLIVQYISQLKADGHSIISTREGYILEKEKNTFRKMIAVKHKADEIEEELMTIVNSGGRVLDVIVEHPLYGELRGRIDVATPDDVIKFISLLRTTNATPLLELSGGIHIHTIETPDEKTMRKVLKSIKKFLIVGGEDLED